LMFFKDSVRGLQPGAPVEFRGIRLGTVSKVPFFAPNMRQTFNDDYRIPVLIRIEPERLKMQLGENADVVEHLGELLKRGLRGSLKTGNLVTGALYVDLDFFPNTPAITRMKNICHDTLLFDLCVHFLHRNYFFSRIGIQRHRGGKAAVQGGVVMHFILQRTATNHAGVFNRTTA
ncbi:MlaD family protein, partial [Terrisporobacter mayombei]|nr:MlaD family protein [Terrisporobacter mayombei]